MRGVRRRVVAGVFVLGGAAGVTVCLAAASAGMRDVIVTDGGSCASGGPYVVAHQCSGADMRLLMIGILGGLVAAGVYALATAALGSPVSAGLVAWTGLFGVFGWNFIDKRTSVSTGIIFLAMAAGGLVLLLARVAGEFNDARRAGPRGRGGPASVQPLVRAAVVPGLPEPMAWYEPGLAVPAVPSVPAVADSTPLVRQLVLRTGAWLGTTLAGAGAGIAASSAVIALIRG